MTRSLPKIKLSIWLGFFMLLSFNLSGCVIIPTPADVHWSPTRQNITPESIPFVIPGQTTKEEVVLRLGEPDEISDDRSRFAYFWLKHKLIAIIVAPHGGVGTLESNRRYVFSITFDENNLVSGKGFYTRELRNERDIIRIDRYSVKSENHDFKGVFNNKKISVGPFTSFNPGQAEFACNMFALIKTPVNEAYSSYIRKAFISELDQLDAYSPQADVTLSAYLDAIDYDELTNRYLGLMITVNSSNGKSLTVWGKHEIPKGGTLLPKRCPDLAKAFQPVVQQLIGKLIRSSEFPALITPVEANREK
jgi:hypothetical protein